MKSTFVALIVLIISFNFQLTDPWILQSIRNIQEYSVRHVTVYYMRAFICIESLNSTNRIPTFVEATWPENIVPKSPKIFPSPNHHACCDNECDKIQTATSSDIDKKLRLWLLDNGSKYCQPKIWIMSIVSLHDSVIRVDIDADAFKVTSLVVDPYYSKNGSSRGFISIYKKNYLLIYYLKEKKFVKIFLMSVKFYVFL